MPRLSRLTTRLALLWLAAGLAGGVALALGRSGAAAPWALALRPVVIHALVVGWLTQLIFGVATWLFPRRKGDRGERAPRTLAAGLVALNLGLVLRVAAEPALALGAAASVAGPGLVISAVAQAAGALVFAAHLWRRVGAR